MRVLFIGDLVGKAGRKAVTALLPGLRKELNLDLVIANVENLAHGKGVTRSTLEEVRRAGVDVATSGNHIWGKDEAVTLLADGSLNLLRPGNYPAGSPGVGAKAISVGSRQLLVVNLQGRVFMEEDLDDPFRMIDAILAERKAEQYAGIIVDFHAEATSEKVAFGWYVNGRVSAVLGTHTHVGTVDAWVLPAGTAYVSDVGMTGPKHSVIGVERKPVIDRFLTQQPTRFEPVEEGPTIFSSVLVEIDPESRKAKSIERIDRELAG